MKNQDALLLDTCPFDFLKKNFTCMTRPHKHVIPYQHIDDLRCLRSWSKKKACALHGRPKLQSSHYQNKNVVWQERWLRDTTCCYDHKSQIFVVLLGVQTKERQEKSQILVIIEYLLVLTQKASKVDSCSQKRKLDRRSNWQLKKMQQAFHQW